ncbi:cytochrome P450 [Mucor mucedo]|uniref:cytochrome P450 n=1 Tax=Mucor mucedo TaxID=29922 RepID=UPI00221F94FF|nr:cytochrome P450 [Mucor mucedo]KAI7895384.1 cytochrome P450 [Mucor mucedo]
MKNECITLSAAATITYILWRLYKRSNRKSCAYDPSLLPPLIKGGFPFLGNLLALQENPGQYLDKVRDSAGPCFRLKIPGQGNLVVVTGPLIGEVMKSSKNFNFNRGIEVLIPSAKVVKASYQHKFVVEQIGPREKHPIIYPIRHNFRENQIDVFSERIQSSLKKALDKELTLQQGEQKSVNILNLLTVIISYISCPCFAGSKVGSNEELIAGMATFTRKIIKAGVFLSILPFGIGSFFVRNFLSVEHEMDLIMKLLVPELQKIRSGEVGDNYEVTFATMALNLPKEDGALRTVEDAAYHFNGIALASIHTTSHFASFALHELACRPSLVEDLRKEIATLGNDKTPESVATLDLMDSFFREVLRCNVDYLGMHHLSLQDTVMSSGHIIPKGSLVVGAVEQAHRDNRLLSVDEDTGEVCVGASPLDVFDGYRFLNRKMKSTAIGLDHLAFGIGPHACPGRYFAANEIKYVIAEMLVRYNIRTKSGKRAKDNVLLGMTRFPPLEHLVFEGL